MCSVALAAADESASERTGALAHLADRLGHSFADPDLLDLALRHRSWCAEHGGVESNERLEFLGDAVLGMVVTDRLFRSTPDAPEGVLARRRSELVNSRVLADLATSIGLGDAILVGRGEESTGGREKASILADAMEAVFGAIYLDAGLDEASAVVLGLLAPHIEHVSSGGPGTDYKSRLQEIAARRFDEVPSYHIAETGPDHDKWFDAVVTVGSAVRGEGGGRSKKQAEQAAAAEAYGRLVETDEVDDGDDENGARDG
jgi:ribonuclease-3